MTLYLLSTGEDVYEHMTQQQIQPDIALYNSLIYFYVKCGNPFKALSIWQKIKSDTRGPQPNINTYTNILIACGESGALELGKSIHLLISQRGLQYDPILESTLIKMYADCGRYFNTFTKILFEPLLFALLFNHSQCNSFHVIYCFLLV